MTGHPINQKKLKRKVYNKMLWILLSILFCLNISTLIIASLAFIHKSKENFSDDRRDLLHSYEKKKDRKDTERAQQLRHTHTELGLN